MNADQARALFLEHCEPGDLSHYGEKAAVAAIVAAANQAGEADARLRMFLEILSASGGQQDASDTRWNWVNAFCGEHEGRDPDTFNLAEQRGYTTVSHNTDTDEGMVYLTASGRAYLATQPGASQESDIDQQADNYAAEYVMTTEGNDYVPTEWERELIIDALHGFIADHWTASVVTQPATLEALA